MNPCERKNPDRSAHACAPPPELLRASGLCDLLAAVPSMIGMQPENALVVVPFLARRAGGGFRLSLPQRLRRTEIEALAHSCVRVVESIPQANSALAILYTSDSYEEAHGIPLRDLGRAVVRRLERTTLGIVGVACVASDGWGRYTDPGECRNARPLSEIDGSETGLLARAATPEPLNLAALAELPRVSAEDRESVAKVLARPSLGIDGIVPLVEHWLTGSSTPRQEGMLIRILQSSPFRDQTTVQIALGPSRAQETCRWQRYLERTQRLTHESMDEIVGRELDASGSEASERADADLLMGTGPAPDCARIELATAALARAAALAPRKARPAVLTVLAWCWWARGVSSLASAHLEEALRIDPSYSMAQLYWSVFAARSVPDWVLDAASRSLVAAERR